MTSDIFLFFLLFTPFLLIVAMCSSPSLSIIPSFPSSLYSTPSPLTVENIKKGSFPIFLIHWIKSDTKRTFPFFITWFEFSISLSKNNTIKQKKKSTRLSITSVFSFSCGVRMKVPYLDSCPSARFLMRWLTFSYQKTGTSQTFWSAIALCTHQGSTTLHLILVLTINTPDFIKNEVTEKPASNSMKSSFPSHCWNRNRCGWHKSVGTGGGQQLV